MEDSLTDIIACNIGDEKLSGPLEAKTFVMNQVKRLVQGFDALLVGGALDRIAAKVLLFSMGKSAPMSGKLGKLVRSVKLSDKYKVPLVQLYHEGEVPKVLVRIPAIHSEDKSSYSAFESIMSLLHYTTGVKPQNMLYVFDDSLGTDIKFDTVHNKLIDELTASAALPSGAFPGEVVTIGQFKGNLPTLLSTMHFLARKGNYLRKRSPQGKEEVYCVSSQELRATFNTRTGLTDKSKSYSAMLLKAALAVTVSTTNRVFPGGWIKATRSLNQVKSDSGLAYKLGYAEKAPYHHKLMSIIQNRPIEKPDGKLHLVSTTGTEYKEYSFLEFRAGFVFTIPSLTTSAEVSFDTQVKKDPLSIKNEDTINAYSDQKYYKAIDSLNRAHALLVTVNKGNSKTKPIHYEIARNEFLHLCAKVPLKDGSGREGKNISDIQQPLVDYCRKLYRFPVKSKRTFESVETEEMQIDSGVAKKTRNDASSTGPVTRARSAERGVPPPASSKSSSQAQPGKKASTSSKKK